MAVDIEQLYRIHQIESELRVVDEAYNDADTRRDEVIAELPEHELYQTALALVRSAREDLKRAIAGSAELARLTEERAEYAFHRRDLKQILSHHLVAYHDETGRDALKDIEGRTRQLELTAKYGKPTLDQERLPLGLAKHFGARVEIAETPEPQHLAEAA